MYTLSFLGLTTSASVCTFWGPEAYYIGVGMHTLSVPGTYYISVRMYNLSFLGLTTSEASEFPEADYIGVRMYTWRAV